MIAPVPSSDLLLARRAAAGQADAWDELINLFWLTLAVFTFLNSRLVGRFGARRSVRGMLIPFKAVSDSGDSTNLHRCGADSYHKPCGQYPCQGGQ